MVASVLFVDDEPNVLQGLRRLLRRDFDVHLAQGGAEALEAVAAKPDFAVVCSDFRMPGMDGATLLAQIRERLPDASRMLLSGQADLQAMMRVVNQGAIHRFLLKPCEQADLALALRDAVEIHRLRCAERELLEGTVAGSVRVMGEALAMASPEAFGFVEQIRDLVLRMADVAGVPKDWTLQTTATLCGIGFLAVPPDTLCAWRALKALSAEDANVLRGVPLLSAALVRHVPRMEEVSRQIAESKEPTAQSPWASQAIAAAQLYLRHRNAGLDADSAITRIRRHWLADPELLDQLSEVVHARGDRMRIEIGIDRLRVGMILACDLVTSTGLLLLAAGSEVSPGALERVRNFSQRFHIQTPIHVLVHVEDAQS